LSISLTIECGYWYPKRKKKKDDDSDDSCLRIRDLGEGNGVKEGEGKVRYFEAPDGFHDYLVFAFHEPERTDTLVGINKWVY
jgi:hypothetical protein